MANPECKKCHGPLLSEGKCEACKQMEIDRIKSIGKMAVTIIGGAWAIGTAALSIVRKIRK